MKPVNFPEANVVYGKDQPEYLPLPVYQYPDAQEGVYGNTSCWKMSWKERFKIFFQGHIYCTLLTGGGSILPQRVHLTLKGE